MMKIMLWVVSKDNGFLDGALNILERQHNGIELVGVTAEAPIQIAKDGRNVPFVPLDKIIAWGGVMMYCLSSARNKSA